MRHKLTLGDHVYAFGPNQSGTRRPQVRQRDAVPADQLASGRGDVPLRLAHPIPEQEAGEASAVGQVPEPGEHHRTRDDQADAEDRERLDHVSRRRRGADHREYDGAPDRREAEQAGHAEAGEYQDLDGQRDEAQAEEQDLLPSREAEHQTGSEEETE